MSSTTHPLGRHRRAPPPPPRDAAPERAPPCSPPPCWRPRPCSCSRFTYWPVLQVLVSSLTVRGFGGAAHPGIGNYARLFADPHFATRRHQQRDLRRRNDHPQPDAGAGLRARPARVHPLRHHPAHADRPAAADPAGRRRRAVHFHLPARRRLARLLPGASSALGETNWLGDPSLALGSIIAITVWKNTGYYMLFFLAGLAGIPQDFIDAAKIDGAGAVATLLPHHACRC